MRIDLPTRLFNFSAVLLTLGFCASCQRIEEQYKYVVVSSKKLPQSEALVYGDSDIIIFTVKHKGVTIKTHCQAFDIRNHCNELVVGESYDFKRDDKLRFLTLKRGNEDSWAILGIEEEHTN